MRCYKYSGMQYALAALQHGIYAGSIDNFNDPYEAEGIRYRDDYRVCCTTTSNRAMLMWSYYGSHKECCIEYEIDDNPSLVRKVQYDLIYRPHRDMSTEQIIENLYHKASLWKEEKEIRIVYHRPTANADLWNIHDNQVYFKARVKSITFGCLVNMTDDAVQSVLKYISEQEKSGQMISVNKLQLSQKKFKLVPDPQFDYHREIVGLSA